MGSRAATTATATIAAVTVVWVSWAAVAADASVSRGGGGREREEVEYDGRALIIEGERRMLFSGSIHYPRSTPSMWPSLITKAKEGGLDVIQTYVFWNVHEPIIGQYNFEGRYDLVRFIKEVHAQGLYVSLRIGPFVESEWKYGGFPFWLHDVPGITFRCDNEPFKWHMERFVTKIVDMMKSEELYYPQGGPIIISQIENEYQMVEPAFHQRGPPYVRWAASMAVALQTGVPWMMCKQNDAPDPVINSCNGLICGETFVGPNSPNKPSLWTENWTTKYLVYGKEAKFRSAEDIAFATALFIAKKNGSFVNYYMYHGGTNFGRSASSFVTTGYYDHAPLDEYGLIWQPTWAHLGKLHAAIKLSSEPLLWGTYTNQSFSQFQEAHIFQTNSGKCIAFLVNFNKHQIAAIKFRNTTFELPAKSISVLLNCRNETFNTAKVTAQNGTRSAKIVDHLKNAERWKVFSEEIASIRNAEFTTNQLLEQMSTTKDATDYLWYSVSYNHTPFSGQELLQVESRAHVLHAFVNNEFVGSVHGSHHGPPLIVLDTPIPLVQGQNNISLLSVMVGSPDSGAYLERRFAGLRSVSIRQRAAASQNLNNHQWAYQVGLVGEKEQIYSDKGSENAEWRSIKNSTNKPLMWYKTTFDAPHGDDPVALNLSSMGKGEVWINGESIGRYWVSFKASNGQPSQSLYHVPRSFLKDKQNLLILFEEIGGDPVEITVNTMSVTRVCSRVSETSTPSVFSKSKQPSVHLHCQEGKRIEAIEFASYGNSFGDCEGHGVGSCHSNSSKSVVEKACVGKFSCSISVTSSMFGGDPCPGTEKSLFVVASCS
ncbi:beta-galactosidase 7-like isoform X1 [Ananas comosus]|uniref:Beta-galactosidase n=1 Tax=Ananas comosus TaxID=4615 RepID=A0A6P5ERP1_ANACO|nr:beta-galactosidase 7-like isoform X1 [Ananas comosus]